MKVAAPLVEVAAIGLAVVSGLATDPANDVRCADSQRRQLDAIAALARIAAVPTVVLGDLDATLWSRPFQRLLARGGLRASRAGFGVQASFPAGLAILRIPIDHVLVSAGIGVRERRIERDVGSDHLPVYVELAVSRPTWTIRPYLTGTALAHSRFDASIMSL